MPADTIPDAPTSHDQPFAPTGYTIGEVLGRGGMGEVLLARDPAIGRDVAIKRMRATNPDPDAIDRFLREAKIQARLDHPAIVPVHELGRDAQGRPYFAMKRLAGVTLFDLLAAGDQPLQRILRALVDVCLAIDFAHARGIVHRDLKPANIMLGEYGEVYVLDWGLARVVVGRDQPSSVDELPYPDGGATQHGAILGTPGYMPPEQIHDARGVREAADVYALGAILFELLAGERLHPDDDALATTLTTPTVAPHVRAPGRDIPPELDAVCEAALAADPARRPTARALGDRLQAYLDGDRDVEARRALAREHLAIAHAAIASGDADRHVIALRAANHAFALDPASTQAASTVMALVLEPPRELPPTLRKHLRERELDLTASQELAAHLALAAPLAFWPVAIGLGVTSWTPMIAGTLLIFLMMGLTHFEVRARRTMVWPWLVTNALLVAIFTRLCGQWVLVPALAVGLGMTLLGAPGIGDRPRHVLAALVVGYLAPVALESVGALSSTWEITTDGRLLTWSSAFTWGGTPGAAFLLAGNLTVIVVVSLFARALASSRRDVHRHVEIQRWQLAQLLPQEARRAP